MSQVSQDPKVMINEGAARAKNMGVAAFMIVFLLSKYFVVKICWKPMERWIAIIVVRSAVYLTKAYERLKPHVERLKVLAHQTKNKAMRLALGLLIVILTPVENLLLRFFGIAKTQSERLALQSTTSILTVVATMMRATGAALKAGLSKPAMQKLLMKLFEVLEDAQKA
ncbi:MAG: hypothetical protein JWM80_5179 [Cyanobacteria bacterium RYN_339]|nr:hypothetical protein [Cyanobacteria bacterium RYN_339]